jgi:hypothetical protein
MMVMVLLMGSAFAFTNRRLSAGRMKNAFSSLVLIFGPYSQNALGYSPQKFRERRMPCIEK